MSKKSYSQYEQDLAVLRFYKMKKNGFYLDIGAFDGVKLSNTYLLEKDYDWKGICVEPLPSRYEELVKSRPNSICVNNACYSQSHLTVPFFIANNFEMLSGISHCIDSFHVDEVNANKTEILVKTMKLNDILEQHGAPRFIEYLSLDTEGSEFEILKAVDFSKYTFGIIHVEHNYVEKNRSRIQQLLLANNYKYIRENHYDDCYMHNSLAQR
jgi:FkbM family methyltransferase